MKSQLVRLLPAVLLISFSTAICQGEKVVEWNLNEGQDTVAYDTSGNSNDGTLDGSPQWVEGLVGYCLEFTDLKGARDAVIADTGVTNLPTGASDPWTINMYIYLEQQPSQAIGGFGDGTDTSGTATNRLIYNWDGIYVKTMDDASDLWTGVPYDLNNWQMITVTYDGMVMSAYKNGVEIAYRETTLLDAAPVVRLGNIWNWSSFAGKIDEFTIWNEALTQSDINNLAKVLPGNAEKVVEWRLDENDGTIVSDSTANGNDGTFFGDPQWTEGTSGSCLEFDGDGDYVSSDGEAINIPTDPNDAWSMNVYLYIDAPFDSNDFDEVRICGFGQDSVETPGNGRSLANRSLGRGISFMSEGIETVSSGVHYNIGKWQMITVIYEPEKLPFAPLKMYKNGALIKEADPQAIASSGRLSEADAVVYLAPHKHTYAGKIDHFSLWNDALTQEQIIEMLSELPPPIPATNVLQWSMDEGEGTTLTDSSGNGNEGTMLGGPQWTEGMIGTCLEFDGADDWVRTTGIATNLPTNADDPWSMNVYVYIEKDMFWNTSYHGTRICGFGVDDWDHEGNGRSIANYSDGLGNGGVSFASAGVTPIQSNVGYSVGKWQMVTITYDLDEVPPLKIYKNSVRIGGDYPEGTDYEGMLNDANSIATLAHLGDQGLRFNGKLDEFTLWAGALTPTQIDDLSGQMPKLEAVKMLEWKLDESWGDIANDSTENESDGQLLNFADPNSSRFEGAAGICLAFDGDDDNVATIEDALLPTGGADDWSMNVCVYVDHTMNENTWHGTRICGFGADSWDTSGEGRSIGNFAWDNGISFISDGVTPIGSSVLYDVGRWQMVTVTYEFDLIGLGQDPLKIYKNGVLIASGNPVGIYYTGTFYPATPEAHLAHISNEGARFDGKIDEFSVWWYALSEEQIQQLMEDTRMLRSDLDGDRDVDIDDLAMFAYDWLSGMCNAIGDIDFDCQADLDDVSVFSSEWNKQIN